MFDYILFDLDGTLTDPYEGITNAHLYALEKCGVEIKDKSTLAEFIGPPLYDTYTKAFGFDHEKALKAVGYFREYFPQKGIYENRLFDGITDILAELKKHGKTVILATCKLEEFAVEILRYFGLSQYFDFVAGATWDSTRIQKAEVIAYALQSCNVTDKTRAIMIGDREHDVAGAKANGLKCAGVLYGFGSEQELKSAGADYILKTPDDVLKIIL